MTYYLFLIAIVLCILFAIVFCIRMIMEVPVLGLIYSLVIGTLSAVMVSLIVSMYSLVAPQILKSEMSYEFFERGERIFYLDEEQVAQFVPVRGDKVKYIHSSDEKIVVKKYGVKPLFRVDNESTYYELYTNLLEETTEGGE